MLGAALVFVPLAIAVPVMDLGIGWLWAALFVFMVLRFTALYARFQSKAWLGERLS